jgi:hypothetical protein
MALEDEAGGKPKFGAKSDFVRSLDRTIPAAQVVAMAEQRGLKLTPSFVYNVRSSYAQKSAREVSVKKQTVAPKKTESAEAVLRHAIAQIGLAKAREILDEVEATFAGR